MQRYASNDAEKAGLEAGLSKLNSVERRGRRSSRRPGYPDEAARGSDIYGPGASGVRAPDSLERR